MSPNMSLLLSSSCNLEASFSESTIRFNMLLCKVLIDGVTIGSASLVAFVFCHLTSLPDTVGHVLGAEIFGSFFLDRLKFLDG